MNDGKKKSLEEKLLRSISTPSVSPSNSEAAHDRNTTTASDYDEWFMDAMLARQEENIQRGYGTIQHPTTRAFQIGIDSIRQGKPSELFLSLLEEIAKMAEDKDVLALLFPEDFPRRIKTSTVRAAQRDMALVEQFKSYLRDYLARPRKAILNGKEGIDAEWTWADATYAEAMASFKYTLSPDKCKALDRALEKHGQNVLECRDWIAAEKRQGSKKQRRN